MEKLTIEKENTDKATSLYRDIFENAPIGIYTIGKDGIIDSFNPAMLQINGAKNLSEVVGLNALELPSYKKAGLTEFLSNGLAGRPFAIDMVHYTSYAAGKKTVRSYKGVPIKNNDGTVAHLLLFVEDITEKDRLHRQLNGLIDNLPEGILIENEERKITYVNQGFCKLFGISVPPSALVGSDCYQASLQSKNLFINPDEFINRVDVLLKEKKIQQSDKLELIDGRVFERDYVPVFSEFEYLGNMWAYRDITERQKAITYADLLTKDLQQAKAKDEAILANIAEGLVVFNLNGEFLIFNEQAKRILGKGPTNRSPEFWPEVYGMYSTENDKKMIDVKDSALARAMRGEIIIDEEILIKNDAKPEGIYIKINIGPIRINNKITAVVFTFTDITHEKEIEQMKTDIISLASHQLKTPLAELKGFIENMLDGYVGNFSESQMSYLQDMKEISGRGYKLVSDLLDISSLERGVFNFSLKPLKLSEIVKDITNEYKKPIEDKGLALRLVSVSGETEILADADKLKEALRNIINNAIKFTPYGSITLEQRMDDKFAILVIRDTGTGITPEKMGALFKRGKILSGQPVAGAGAGLGLYIAKRFIELQNGTIEFHSQVGQGTEVTIKIPTHLL